MTVAGVDVGGMKADEARAAVQRELQGALDEPIVVRRGDQRFTLSAQDAGVHADVGGMIDEAVAKSRDGSIVTRVARDITGGSENAQVPARVTYSEAAVNGLVKRVAAKLDQEPQATRRSTSPRWRRSRSSPASRCAPPRCASGSRSR